MTTIAVFGCGFVGSTVANFLDNGGIDVIKVDPKLYPETDPKESAMNADGVVICVPTPSKQDGSCDDKHIKDVLELCDQRTKILLKCSVTSDLLETYDANVIYNPEFLPPDFICHGKRSCCHIAAYKIRGLFLSILKDAAPVISET